MKALTAASAAALIALLLPADAQAQAGSASDPKSPTPVQVVQRPQGNSTVFHTEVKPGVWVHGRPNKPIFSGSLPIIPEVYDYMPAPGSGR